MYTHEVKRVHGLTGVQHYAERTLPSGLFSMSNIGHSFMIPMPTTAPEIRHTTLTSPSPLATAHVARTRTEGQDGSSPEVRRISCTDLDEFVERGAELWRQLIANLSDPYRIDIHHAEDHHIELSDTLPSGLLVSKAPEVEFQGYRAMPDEMEALERMVRLVQPKNEAPTRPGSGSYL